MEFTTFYTAAIISILISTGIILATLWGHHTKIDIEKTSIYECGFTPYSQPRSTYNIKFYLVSLLFIVFDVEVLFLFPIALNLEDLHQNDLQWALLFLGYIFVGIYYEIKSQVLEFSCPVPPRETGAAKN